MRKKVIALLLAVMVCWPVSVQGQGISGINSLEVDLWPENDRPQMLVIYRLQLDSGTNLPATLSLRIPAVAGDPTAVAVRNPDGKLYKVDYVRQISGQWAVINFTTPVDEAQIEYYDPSLAKNGTVRSFTYAWPGDYAVKRFIVQVQQPSGASNMQINPSLGSGALGDGGLMYYSSDLGSYPAEQEVSISLSYQKANDNLSVQSGKVEPSTPVNTSTPGRLNLTYPWLYGLSILALAIIAVGGWLYFRSARNLARNPRYRHAAYRERPTQPISSDQVYCHQCGKKASAGDTFCRSCGTRLRRD